MKQYAARGKVDRWGSTSVKRCDLDKTLAGMTQRRVSDVEAWEGVGAETGCGRFSLESEARVAIGSDGRGLRGTTRTGSGRRGSKAGVGLWGRQRWRWHGGGGILVPRPALGTPSLPVLGRSRALRLSVPLCPAPSHPPSQTPSNPAQSAHTPPKARDERTQDFYIVITWGIECI